MKQIIRYLKIHLGENYSLRYYLSIALFLSICIFTNYYLDFEDGIIDSYYGKPVRMLFFFLFYAFAYYAACIIYAYFKNAWHIFQLKGFWLKSLFCLAILSVDVGSHYHSIVAKNYLPEQIQFLGMKVMGNLAGIFTTLIPFYIFWKAYDKQQESYYGLTIKKFDTRPYLFMLLVMTPLIFGASYLENFNKFYPMYKSSQAHLFLNLPEYWSILAYEIAYGFNFFSIELVFRGFMVIGMSSLLGRDAIIPMITTYCFLHFGKPEGEAISSIFGGFVLGVVAYESKSILGGVIIHMGIAWLMEAAAFFQKA